MGIEFTDRELMILLSRFLWPLFRIGAFLMVLPLLGTRLVTRRIRVGLAVLITFLVVPLLPPMPIVDLLSLQTYLIVAEQIAIGVMLAFLVQILFQIFVLTGRMISMQMGLGMAAMMDPVNGIQVSILSSFYLMLTSLLFFASNGHLVVIEVLIESFYAIPIALEWRSVDSYFFLVSLGSWMFASALFIAIPAVTAILIINFSFGVMTRAAPQMNIFALGFPFTMMMGLVIIWVSLSGFLPQYQAIVSECLQMLRGMITV